MRTTRQMPVFGDSAKPLVVVTTVTPWDEPPRIRHQVSVALSNEYNVLFVQTYPKVAAKPKKISETLITLSVGRYVRGLARFFLMFPSVEGIFKKLTSNRIGKVITNNYLAAQTHIVNFNYDFPEIYDLNIFEKRVFIYNDDFVAMAKGSAHKKHAQKRLNKVLGRADITFAVSDYLVNQLKLYTQNVTLMRHGVYFIDDKNAVRPVVRKGNILNACYMGYINDRLNLEWVEALLKEKNIFFWFVGPVQSEEIKKRFSFYENCRFIPPLYGAELLSKLTEMDVLVMPYAVGRLSSEEIKSISPNKTFLYLNAGRAIVTSDLPYIRELPSEYFYIAHSKDEFRELVVRAAKEDDVEKRRRRFYFARDNSWSVRVTTISKFLAQTDGD